MKKITVLPLLLTFLFTSCAGVNEDDNTSQNLSLKSLAVTTQPTKTTYTIGEELNTAGLVVTATYSDDSTKDVTASVQIAAVDMSSAGQKTVSISYSENGSTLFASFIITVNQSGQGGGGDQGGGGEEDDYVDTGEYGYNHFNGYYGQLTWSNGDDLKQKLYNIISQDVTFLEYEGNWATNQNADQDLYNHDYVDVVYSSDNMAKSDTYSLGHGWQREHAYAASLMTGIISGNAVKTKGRATDFHNLLAANNSGNTSRGNKNFGTANKSDSTYQNPTMDPTNTYHLDYSFDSKNFEPSDYDKGRLSRAIFYMGVMYSQNEETAGSYQTLNIVEDYVEYSDGNCQYAIGNLSTLINWNNNFTVDYLEYQHNESVYSHEIVKDDETKIKQGNRNPFVDYPGLVDYVYGSKKDQAGDLNTIKPSEVILRTDKTGVHHYAIENVQKEFGVGDTFDSSCYDLIAVDHKLGESAAPASADLTTPYTFTDADLAKGSKEVTVKTAINEIKITVKVTAATLTGCKYHYVYSKDDTSPIGSSMSANSTKTGTLNGENWTFATINSVQVRRQNTGLAIGSTTSTAEGMTITSQKSFDNIDRIIVKLGASSGATFKAKVEVGDQQVAEFTVTYNSSDTQLYIKDLTSPLSGQVKITFSQVSGAVYLGGIGVNY